MQNFGVMGVKPAKIDAVLVDAAEGRQIAEGDDEEIQRQLVAITKRLDVPHGVVEPGQTLGDVVGLDDEAIVVEQRGFLALILVQNQTLDRLAEALAPARISHGAGTVMVDHLLLPVLENLAMNARKQFRQIRHPFRLIMRNRALGLLLEGAQQAPAVNDGQRIAQLLELAATCNRRIGRRIHGHLELRANRCDTMAAQAS